MALRWAWDWGLGLATSFYANDVNWAVFDGGAKVDTANVTNLVSPPVVGAPGEQFNCLINGGDSVASVYTPVFPGVLVTEGYFVTRWRKPSGSMSSSSGANIVRLMEDGATQRVALRADIAGSPVPLEIFVNGTSVGTSTRLVGDAASYVFSIDFDMAAVPPEAGLLIDGVREITRASGSGTAVAIRRAAISSGTANQNAYHGLLLLFDSLGDVRGEKTTYWGIGLDANTLTDGDGSWTIFGGAASKVAAISDRLSTTGISTTTDPDVVTVGFENTTDILAGWLPSTILMVVAVGVGFADVIENAAIDLSDGTGSAATATELLTSVQSMVIAYAELNSTATAWTADQVNAATYTYTVSG